MAGDGEVLFVLEEVGEEAAALEVGGEDLGEFTPAGVVAHNEEPQRRPVAHKRLQLRLLEIIPRRQQLQLAYAVLYQIKAEHLAQPYLNFTLQ